MSTSAPRELGQGWVATQDPASGREYYANTLDGRVSWDLPIELRCVLCCNASIKFLCLHSIY